MARRLRRLVGGLLILTLLLAACGGGGSDEPDTNTTDDTTSDTAVEQDAAPTPTQETVVQGAGDVAAQAATTQEPPPEPQLPVDENGAEIIARVNGEAITMAEFQSEFQRRRAQSAAADENALAVSVMDTMIEQMLIQQAADTLGITVSDDQIEADLQENIRLIGGEDAWADWLAMNGYTQAEYRERVLPASILTPMVIAAVTGVDDGSVTEVRARHILVNTEIEAMGVLDRLQAGEDFATLASQYSNDVTTRDQGGDLGWFIREDLMTPELADVALNLQPMQVAGPVTTLLGYHIIQTLEVRQRELRDEDLALVVQAQFETWLEEQQAAAVIERYLY